MIISEKQIMMLIEATRILTINESYPIEFRKKMCDLIYDINHQQSEELKVIE